MTLVKFNDRPSTKNYNSLMDSFFNGFPTFSFEEKPTGNLNGKVPVNIKENEQAFLMEVVAPGFSKEDFEVKMDQNLLTISVKKGNEKQNEKEKVIRSEFSYKSFSRSFTIDEQIDANNISANYTNGVLVLNLPKKPEVKASTKQITVK